MKKTGGLSGMNIIFALVLIAGVAAISLIAFKSYKFNTAFPEKARVKNLKNRYADLVVNLNEAVSTSDTTLSLAKELENIQYPDETLSVSMKSNSNQKLSIIDRFEPRRSQGSLHSFTTTSNGGGYGKRNGQHFWVLHHQLVKHDYEYIEILIGHNEEYEQLISSSAAG